MGELVQASLTKSPSNDVKVAGALLVMEMVNVQKLLADQLWTDLSKVFQAMIDTGTSEPAFWKPKLSELVQLCATVCKEKRCQEDIRNLALEFVVNYAENSPK